MSDGSSRPADDHRVEHPALAQLASLAREQVAAPVTVTFESVQAEAHKRRQRQWASWGTVALLAAAALLWIVRPAQVGAPEASPSLAQATPSSRSPSLAASPPVAADTLAGPEPTSTMVPSAPAVASLRLGGGGSIVRVDTEDSVAGVGSVDALRADTVQAHTAVPQSVRLSDGEFRVETGSRGVDLVVYDRVLEVAAASTVTVTVSVQSQRFEAEAGAAKWRDSEPERGGRETERRPSAEALARRAETQMKASNRPAAIRTLTLLARRYPRSGASKAAILDLARLRKAGGQPDHARCAYELFLKRWPKAGDAEAVRRARDRLPGSQACRGLEPQ